MKACLAVLMLIVTVALSAAEVIEFKVHSAAMSRDIPALAVLPDSVKPDTAARFSTVYLLHGYGDNSKTWNHLTDLKGMSDRYGIIFVCPDGKKSFYLDHPTDSKIRFETHIINELIPYVDRRFPTRAERKFRAISGLSMGGHGAIWLAARHPQLFIAAGSQSGALMPQFFNEYLKISAVPAIIIDCGIDDRLLSHSQNLHRALLDAKIPHDYIERPGKHDWDYWRNSVEFQTLFFHRQFLK